MHYTVGEGERRGLDGRAQDEEMMAKEGIHFVKEPVVEEEEEST